MYINFNRKIENSCEDKVLNMNAGPIFNFVSRCIVSNVLNEQIEDACSCSYCFGNIDYLYHKGKYGKIWVMGSKLKNGNKWNFRNARKEPFDTYIMLGYDEERRNILRVWTLDCSDKLIFGKKGITISNIEKGLENYKHYEVESERYNYMLQQINSK